MQKTTMEETVFSSLTPDACNNAGTAFSKVRRHPRRKHDSCVVGIRGETWPVENWSMGGLLLSADERRFSDGKGEDFTMTFALCKSLPGVDVEHSGRVVRRSMGQVAIQFAPLTQAIRRKFQQVIDDCG